MELGSIWIEYVDSYYTSYSLEEQYYELCYNGGIEPYYPEISTLVVL